MANDNNAPPTDTSNIYQQLAEVINSPAAKALLTGGGQPGMPSFMNLGNMSVPMSQLSGFDESKAREQVAKDEASPASLPPEYQKAYDRAANSPYISFADEGWARNHPHIAGALDNALLTMRAIKPPTDASGNPVPTGAGFGIGQVASALSGLPAEKVALREQMAEEPLKYQTLQAQLREAMERGTLEKEQAVTQAGLNAARVGSTAVRDLYEQMVSAAQRYATGAGAQATSRLNDAYNNLTKLSIAHDRNLANMQIAAKHWGAMSPKDKAALNAKIDMWHSSTWQQYNSFWNMWKQDPQTGEWNTVLTKPFKVGDVALAPGEYHLKPNEIQALQDKMHNDIESTYASLLGDTGRQVTPHDATINPSPKQNVKPLFPQGGGKRLTINDRPIWEKFLSAAKGDPAKAEALAKENGWN